MDADAPAATPCMKPASHSLPPPPAPFAVRVGSRSRVADLGAGAAFSGPPDTPPRCSYVTVPFLWEDAPGKPKAAALAPTACAAATAAANDGGEREDSGHEHQARPLPLKLPPRLQQVPASFATPDTPLMSPKTVLHGPYYVCAGGVGGGAGSRSKPPRWARSASAAFRRTPSAAGALFSRTWSKPKAPAPAAGSDKNRDGDHERDAAGPDGPWCSPAASSSSSSSSVSTCFGGDDHGRGRPVDVREVCSEEDDGGSPRGLVRITRLRRNRSVPSMTTSNLWASIRRSVKQITPWS